MVGWRGRSFSELLPVEMGFFELTPYGFKITAWADSLKIGKGITPSLADNRA